MIPYGDFRKTAPASDTTRDRETRQRAAEATQLFGGPASSHGERLDFSAKAAPAALSSGAGTSFVQEPAWKAEMADRDARAARLDKLPAAVQRLASAEGITSVELLETIAIIHRAAKIMSGEAQVHPADVGRSIGVPTVKAEALLAEAVAKGWVEARSGARWRCKI